MAKRRNPTYEVTKPSAAELRAVKNYIVDKIITWSRSRGYCDAVEDGLTEAFGAAPAAGWRDRNGRNCYGFDINGYDEAGYDETGYNEAGYSASGFNKEGFDEEGYGRDGFNADGVNRQGQQRGHLEEYVCKLSPDERQQLFRIVRDKLRW